MAASVNVTLTVDNFYYDSSTNRTKARLDSRFQWSGVPSFKMTDILAISWNNYMQTGKVGGVTYRHIYGTQSDYFKSATYLPPEGGMESYGGGYKWSVSEQDNYFYTYKGYAIFVIEKANYNHLEAYTAYGHQQGYAKLSFSVRSGVDVQFNLQRKNIGDDYFSARYP
ncbi:hypothetical protein NC797_11305 [Aquibacillus sp. 3ASR75-11]|uniref:Uncharacterized protein n=1 Tax=Terrihalobacillus insolitus TaxID=2950438 RepID=A0A9X4AP15_9BACI|nr:hypothetical protein [Terrihalobacillus insolitus]MDC3425093.1 hypothetical protein [Terrihalobacillus insolitus]